MIATQIHLAMTHIPVVGVPVAVIALIFALRSQSKAFIRFALGLGIAISVLTIPVFLSGDPTAEHLTSIDKSVSEHDIHEHDEMAEKALSVTLAFGALCLAALLLAKKEKQQKLAQGGALVVGAVATLVLALTAHLGGEIRHGHELGGVGSSETKKVEVPNHE